MVFDFDKAFSLKRGLSSDPSQSQGKGEGGNHALVVSPSREAVGQGILPIAKSTEEIFQRNDRENVADRVPFAQVNIPSYDGELYGWRLPGHGEAYADCGSWRSKGCLNIEEHVQQGLDREMVGKVFVRRYKRTCMRAECPVCYESWAGKEAGKIEHRLQRAPKKSRPIHLIVSPPLQAWFQLGYEDLRRKAYSVAKKSGFLGGSCIFHPFRENESTKWWYFSPHFHMIGYGWIQGTKEGYEKHGWVVKNAGLRKTVSGTSLYQLSHAGIHQKYHTVTWFGSLSYNKIRIPPQQPEKEVCPICGRQLEDLWYFGAEKLPEEEGDFWLDPEGWTYKPKRFEGG